MTFEQRISEVERLRRIWFGEDRAQSRLDRVLECEDLDVFVERVPANARRLHRALILGGLDRRSRAGEGRSRSCSSRLWKLLTLPKRNSRTLAAIAVRD
jgi:hypothetical protein